MMNTDKTRFREFANLLEPMENYTPVQAMEKFNELYGDCNNLSYFTKLLRYFIQFNCETSPNEVFAHNEFLELIYQELKLAILTNFKPEE